MARGDLAHVALRHASGASSLLTLTHTMPPQASSVTAEPRGSAGISSLPERADGGAVRPFMRAFDALLASARTGEAHPCDARFGLRVTQILARAETALAAPAH
ncbi:hypothetical protein [Streptomyces marincola]|uniref:hypothetical protein n=1 Tax=Streptomyces marincola TaxID=2878388 RepID=UPI001CF54C4A|nr:hypothetical protein [Streptomyces marincola]UCM87468.1 hypothetical protein LC193_05640 [Streptomyces marincola]